MRNVLTSIANLQPGDTWSEADGFVYVVYANEPTGAFERTIKMIAITPNNTYRQTQFTKRGATPIVVDRPE